jgi:hypothetical protein
MKYKRKTKERVLRNRRDVLHCLRYSCAIDISALEENKNQRKKKLLSIVRNEDHCEHNARENEAKKTNSLTIN